MGQRLFQTLGVSSPSGGRDRVLGFSWVLASGWEEGVLSCGSTVHANPSCVGHQRTGHKVRDGEESLTKQLEDSCVDGRRGEFPEVGDLRILTGQGSRVRAVAITRTLWEVPHSRRCRVTSLSLALSPG